MVRGTRFFRFTKAGEPVMEAGPLELSTEDGRLVVANGKDSLVLSLRSGEGITG